MAVPTRKEIWPGLQVAIVQKHDQRSGRHTIGTVREILTASATHPHGIKVRLTDGVVGRVQETLAGGKNDADTAAQS